VKLAGGNDKVHQAAEGPHGAGSHGPLNTELFNLLILRRWTACYPQDSRRSNDPAVFWSRRRAFIDRVSYFQAFAVAAEPHLPASLVRELAAVITRAVEATEAGAGSA
jgi:hypothetical protein